eukprot:TRINITY_DN13503_c1_g3_i2.p1 TRINITY_DN13503_c1_g3~~TRINITY_DN13503_c1_g3_i2.p1  ORF type:complete len:692 (+),score=57.07 TRINITY_DN13503_c1_g3_i2:107-2182(+)
MSAADFAAATPNAGRFSFPSSGVLPAKAAAAVDRKTSMPNSSRFSCSSSVLPTVTRLASQLPSNLLRAVPTDCALQGYGKHWKGLAGDPNDFLLSAVTPRIDDFISHDWKTSRTQKYVTLLYIYNARAALLGSTIFAVMLAVTRHLLRAAGFLQSVCDDDAISCKLGVCLTLGPIAYFVLFFHWQAIRSKFVKNNMLFVDKLCIAQHDDDMKNQCILGLAAFLRHAQRIVVLWSPAYFSRLWCTYELAAWFRFERQLSSVMFVPVQIPPVICLLFAVTTLQCSLFHSDVIRDVETFFTGLPMLAITPLFCYVLQGHAAHVLDLRPQLERFSMEQTSCFCCSNGHIDPATGASISCDREMVYHTLRQWTVEAQNAESIDACLMTFNEEVRTTLQHYVTTSAMPERRLFFRYVDFVHIYSPLLWMSVDNTLYRISRGPDAVTAVQFLEGLCAWLLVGPVTLALLTRLMCLAKPLRSYAMSSMKCRLALSCFLWGPIFNLLALVIWGLVRIKFYFMVLGDTSQAICAWSVGVVLLASLAYYVFVRDSKGDAPDDGGMRQTFSLHTSTSTAYVSHKTSMRRTRGRTSAAESQESVAADSLCRTASREICAVSSLVTDDTYGLRLTAGSAEQEASKEIKSVRSADAPPLAETNSTTPATTTPASPFRAAVAPCSVGEAPPGAATEAADPFSTKLSL